MKRYRIAEHGLMPHFLTSTITEWLPVFASEPYFRIITDSLQFCREHKGLLVHAYVIMPTHLHVIGSAHEGYDLSDILRDFRRHTSQAVLRQLDTDGDRLFLRVFANAGAKQKRDDTQHKVWTEGMHPEALVSEEFFLQKLKYLHENPVRKGLVSKPEHWYYSSASAYILGEVGPLELDLLS